MDGITLRKMLTETINEDFGTTEFMPTKTSYDYLYMAAIEYNNRLRAFTDTQSITTVADQAGYTLDHDFMQIRSGFSDNEFYLKYNDGSNNTFLTMGDRDEIIHGDSTTSVTVPDEFYVDDVTLSSNLTGTTTSAGALANGSATLTDTGATFSTNDVSPGDLVHDTTNTLSGVVISVTSETALETAMFTNAGAYGSWADSAAYTLTRQPRQKIVFSPPPSTAGHTVTVYFVQRPAPVYTDFGQYRISQELAPALVNYAAWKYKYRDKASDEGDRLFLVWDRDLRRSGTQVNKRLNRRGFKFSMKKS